MPKRAIPRPPTCLQGHAVENWGDLCEICHAEEAAFRASCRNPPQTMTIGSREGTTYFRIPKHLRPRRGNR